MYLSFVYVGIYWNNHHHMMHSVQHVNGAMLWANLHLLFWLSLFPFVTGWTGENHFAAVPTALYGVVLFMAAMAYLAFAIHHHQATRARFGIGESGRQGLQRKAVLSHLCISDPTGIC